MKKNNFDQIFCILLIIQVCISLVGCSTTAESLKQKAIPNSTNVIKINPSSINIKVKINLDKVLADIDKNIPTNFNTKNDWLCINDNCVKYDAYRENTKLISNANYVRFSTTISYWAEYSRRLKNPISGQYYYPSIVSCGKDLRSKAALETISELKWNYNWFVESRTTFEPVKSIKNCEITFVKYDVTPQILKQFEPKMKEFIPEIDKKIAQVTNFKSKAQELWKFFSEPTWMNDQFWFSFNPDSISVSQFYGSGNEIYCYFKINAFPRLIAQVDKPVIQVKNLPALKIDNTIDKGFKSELDMNFTESELNKLSVQNMKGKKIPTSSSDSVEITDIKLECLQDYIYVETQLKGEYSGKLSFVGKPFYDSAKKEIKLNEFDFSFDSKNTLVKVGDWLLHGSFKENLRSKIGFNIADKLKDSKSAIEKALNRKINDQVRCKGVINSILPTNIWVEKGIIKSIVYADGEIEVEI